MINGMRAMNFTEIVGNEIPPNSAVGYFKSFDGLQLRYGVFKIGADIERGTICLFGGRSEPIEKYFETIKKLQKRGFCVVMMDWRGQGLSDRLTKSRRKGHIENFDHYVKDIDFLMNKIVKVNCPAPYNAVAHSLGGINLTQFVASANGQTMFSKMVLISPFYNFDLSFIKALITKLVAATMVKLGGGELKATFLEGSPKEHRIFDENNLISSDQKRVEREKNIIMANVNLALGAPTFGWLNAAFMAIKKVNRQKFLARVKTQILIVMGLDDHLVSQQAIVDVADNLQNCQLVKIDNGRHELLMENDEIIAATWAAIDQFLLVD